MQLDLSSKFHADDVGRNTETVLATLKLAQKGWLRSYSVMANGEDPDGALSLHKKFPDIPVSLHFDIVTGHAKSGINTLTNKQGIFRLPLKEVQGFWAQLARMIYFGFCALFVYKRRDIVAELELQYAELVEKGFVVKGIDAEQHLHAYAPIAGAVAHFAAKHDLVVRSLGDWHSQGLWPRKKKLLLAITASISYLLRDRRFGLPPTWKKQGTKYIVASWEQIDISKVPKETFIECHPGTQFDVKLWEQL